MDKSKQTGNPGLDPEQYRELIRLFIENTRKEISGIKKALKDNEPGRAEKLAHSFKGAALNLGLEKIAAAGDELRALLRNDNYMNKAGVIINNILQDLDELSRSV
ncbi:MAG: Hpt domain-containing protein [Desulfobacterales bacterium]